MYSTYNVGKFIAAEKFTRTNLTNTWLQNLKNVFVDKLDDIVNEYNNTNHRTIKMKPVDLKSRTYIYFNVENNDKDPKFEASDYVRISKYKIIFAKGYTLNCSEEVFVIKKVKNTVP